MEQVSFTSRNFEMNIFAPSGNITCSVIAGATLACGTGACATVVAAVLEGRAGRVSFTKYNNTDKEK